MNDSAEHPFRSFWMGGYEGADHVNGLGQSLDMAQLNGHADQLEDDHRRAAALGIRSVRETIGWRLCEVGPGRFDLGRALRIAASAQRHGIQVLWTLMHYGTPADVSLLDDSAIDRFARFARAVAQALGPLSDEPPVYNLVNEISFLAWAVSQTDMIWPYLHAPREGGDGTSASGFDIKRRLVRMTLAGIDAVRAVDPRARFLHVEPLVHVVPPADRPEMAETAERISAYQWQAWDLLSGAAEPQLGGEPRALDLIGINHYHSSQWEAGTEERLWWHLRDARRLPFSRLLATAWQRYRRPMMVAETSHFGEGRTPWLDEIAGEVLQARAAGIPVHGICLYPLVDRPDWSDAAQWHHSGLWDVDTRVDASPLRLRRVLCADYAAALGRWQTRLPEPAEPPAAQPVLLVFSHLRWGFVHHRPQQLMSRLAGRFRIVFVEEPLPLGPGCGEAARLDAVSHGPDIEVLIPRTLVAEPGFCEAQRAVIGPLLGQFLGRFLGRFPNGIVAERPNGPSPPIVAWFYTPMALPLLGFLPAPAVVVYDCIDELSGFANAPPELQGRERELLGAADLVLTSGPALQRARQVVAGDKVHSVPNGVEAADFAPSALDAGSAQASDARQCPGPRTGPRLGYCGVVDERIDLALIEALARAHPDWQVVIAGPVVKIDPQTLPRLANIHWLGHQPYARLSHLIASWDVGLIPFVDSPLTRCANPTKTLEYLAADKPVVATPLPDIVELHGRSVQTASGPAAFIAACDQALQVDTPQGGARRAAGRQSVGAASWAARAEAVIGLLAGCGVTAAG